jgi:hypothetical protein
MIVKSAIVVPGESSPVSSSYMLWGGCEIAQSSEFGVVAIDPEEKDGSGSDVRNGRSIVG